MIENRSVVAKGWGEEKSLTTKSIREYLRTMEQFCIMIVVVAA